jgi:predicted AlkP superfamily phosphohydrolase/phosphomutase
MGVIMSVDIEQALIIGLDGGTFDVLIPLVQNGFMPALARLMEEGAWGDLESTIPPFTAAAWSTLATGVNPGEHGLISFQVRDRFNYDRHGEGFVNADHLGITLWEILSTQDRLVGVINVPVSYPARPVNGYMITGMLTPPDAEKSAFPPDLLDRLRLDYMFDVDFIRGEDGFRAESQVSKSVMLSEVSEMTRKRIEASLCCYQEKSWDLFTVIFTGTDRIFHYFWDDLSSMLEDLDDPSSFSDIQLQILEYFKLVDSGIEALTQACPSHSAVMVVSDHGFGPAPTHRFYVNVWLEQLGLLRRRPSKGLLDLEYWRVWVGRKKALKSIVRRLIPESVQSNAKDIAESTSGEMMDFGSSEAYFVPVYFHVCGVEINRVGRQREGVVASEDRYEEIRDLIISEARQLRGANGEPLVLQAVRREDIFSGSAVESFPDVFLILDPDYIGAGSLAGRSLVEGHHSLRPGEHRRNGIFVASGCGIENREGVQDLELLDVPATILYQLGFSIPDYFDGRVLKEVFTEAHLADHPITYESRPDWEETHRRRAVTFKRSQRGESQIGERLRGLGYLE